jgi:hypothetical protein
MQYWRCIFFFPGKTLNLEIMENRIKILGIAFALVTGLAACEKTYIEPQKPVTEENKSMEGDIATVNRVDREIADMSQGVWHITSFQWHLRKEDNPHFMNYSFVFLKEGIVVAKHDGREEKGKWSRQNLFRLVFATEPLKELNNDKWNFHREGQNKFILKGLSPYDNSSEIVVFERW